MTPDIEVVVAFVERFGVPVFPCRPNTRIPATRHGFKDSTRDIEMIRDYHKTNPALNWAMPTGSVSGFDVLDVDNKNGKSGSDTLAVLEAKYGRLPDTMLVLTPSGGFHYYFRHNGAALACSVDKIGVGIDLRTDGGYVMIQPSIVDGRTYAVEASSDPDDVGFAEMPQWLIELALNGTKQSPGAERLIVTPDAVTKLDSVLAGNALHDSLRDLAAHYVALNINFSETCKLLELAMHASQAPRNQRWKDRFAEIPKLVNTAIEKFSPAAVKAEVQVSPDPLAAAAYHGLAGEIVRAIEPHTEADPAALLLQVLVAFGALVGRGPHVRVEGDEHHANLFAVLVGETSKARKGTSWGRVREVFGVDGWPAVVSGLSSGEGLKWHVRDRITKIERDKKSGFVQEVEIDPGVLDKRLLVIEPEFAQVLRQGARAGNTLSATIRCAWDSGQLRTLTKNDPVTATNAHICVVAHITAEELRAELSATDSANGFANRFLFQAVTRSKTLPFGGAAVDPDLLAQFSTRITLAATRARTCMAVGMAAPAREVWSGVYPTLSEGMPGLFGAVTARAEAQCVRLALIYALLDGSSQIGVEHLLAALAVWERSSASARHIFGSAVGDQVADEILRSLRVAGQAGMTRTDIRDLFKRHQSAERIGTALELLSRRKLARSERRATGGREAEIWITDSAT